MQNLSLKLVPLVDIDAGELQLSGVKGNMSLDIVLEIACSVALASLCPLFYWIEVSIFRILDFTPMHFSFNDHKHVMT